MSPAARKPRSRRTLAFAVVTLDPPAEWQVRCMDELAAVPGVEIAMWLRRPRGRLDPEPSLTGPRSEATVNRAVAMGGRADDVHVDVVLDLTAEPVGGALSQSAAPTAAEGWRYRYGPRRTTNVDGAALRSYVRGSRGTRVALVREGDGHVLREGLVQTTTWWRGTLVDHLLADVVAWPAAAARDRLRGPARKKAAARAVVPPAASPPTEAGGSSAGLPLAIGAVGRRILGMADTVLRQPDWRIGIVDATIDAALRPGFLAATTWLPGHPGHYHADPFGIERDGILHVLFEDYDQARGIGTIEHVAVAADGSVSDPVPVLVGDGHRSYPFLVEVEGSVFMLPESSDRGRLELYEADPFPFRWRLAATILSDVPAVDPSVVLVDGTWWLFATRADQGDNHSLSIWHASRLEGPWTPHVGNPVKTDVRSARSGGTPFIVDGTLYRPAQDASRRYGGTLVINRVDELTPTSFREAPVTSIAPPAAWPARDGLHTLSAAGRRTLVDANDMHVVPRAAGRAVGARLVAVKNALRRGRSSDA
jgi:hypothetical protein